MPDAAVRKEELVRALKRYGFNETRTKSHLVFRHDETGLIVTLPATRIVPRVYLRAILTQLSNYNIPRNSGADKLVNRLKEGLRHSSS
jgi:predicted RNA binding protein YcfA (HicA-like mRNA interferase family)